MPLFNFTLTPLEKIYCGKPGEQSLCWYWLTDGTCWLDVGNEKLLEYHADNAFGTGLGFVDYYPLSRLYQDTLRIVRTVLNPIPESLANDISGDGFDSNWQALCSWRELERNDREHSQIDNAASVLFQNRVLDINYLIAPPEIWMWSDTADVHIEWDNRKCIHEGKPVWSTEGGSFRLSRAAFIDEVRDFQNRLMQQMQERADQVCAGALPPEVRIDLTALREEHERRSASIESLFAPPAEPTDWNAVERAIAEIKKHRGGVPD